MNELRGKHFPGGEELPDRKEWNMRALLGWTLAVVVAMSGASAAQSKANRVGAPDL